MAIDRAFVEPMLDPFRDMVKDIDARGLKGKDVDEMKAAMATMERLAREMDDIVSYSTKLATDNLYLNFSNAYSRALSAAAMQSQPTDDGALLTQSLGQYESSLNQLKGNPDFAHLLPPLERALAIGKSGVSYPVFLRTCEEEGLFEEMKCGRQRPVLEFDLHVAVVMSDPLREAMYTKMIAAHDALCAAHPLRLADPVEFEIARQRIEWEFAPRLARWKAIALRWDRLHDIVFDWIDAHSAFAPQDARWKDPRGEQFTQENIQRTRECAPGNLKVREAIFKEYFGLAWDDVFAHETFLNEKKAARLWNSDARFALLRETYPHCQPGGKPPANVVAKNEALFKNKAFRCERNIARFGDETHKTIGYDFAKFSEFVKKTQPRTH